MKKRYKEKKTMNKEILAVVAGEEITKAELDTYLQGVPREQQAYASNPAFREQFLEQLVSLYLFATVSGKKSFGKLNLNKSYLGDNDNMFFIY